MLLADFKRSRLIAMTAHNTVALRISQLYIKFNTNSGL